MTASALYTILYTWINSVINPVGTTVPTPIIKSHQDAPAPSGAYIVISYAPASRTKIGTPSAGDVNGSGIRKLVQDYELRVEIWEVNGDGDKLQAIIDSIDRLDVKTYLQSQSVAYLGEEQVQSIPQIEGTDKWRKESMVEIRLGVAEGISDTTSWIETVEFDSNIHH